MDNEDYESFDLNDRDVEYAANPLNRRRRGQTKEEALYGIFAQTEEDEGPSRSSFGGYSKPVTNVKFTSAGTTGTPSSSSSNEPAPKRPKRSPSPNDGPSSSNSMGNGAQIFAGMRSSNVHGFGTGGNTGGWSAKPSVMNMMKKMGYVPGQGLGANKQGIVEPIVAAVRQGKGAVGAYGPEASAVGQKFGETAAQAQARQREGPSDDAPKADQPTRGNWKKDRKQKPKLKSLAELIAGGDAPLDETPRQKIIDMTGPEQKVYNDFHTLSKVQSSVLVPRKFDIPELTQNVMLLLDRTEDEIRRNHRQCKLLQDQNKSMEIDVERIRDALVIEKQQVTRMESVMELVSQFNERNITLDEVKGLLQKLRRKFPKEYREYGLVSVALATAIPIMKTHFANWDPLDPEQVVYGMEVMEEWRSILEGEGGKAKTHTFDRMKSEQDALPAFDRCLWDAWMPRMRECVKFWDVRLNSAAMLEVFTSWMPMLSDGLVDHLLDQCIMPRIQLFVNEWNPLTDSMPIDSWLLPWHPILGHRTMEVYPGIRMKLGKALRGWIPTDGSAYAVLLPWKNAFTQKSMREFLNLNIVPKLERALMDMNLNPMENTDYLEFCALLNWIDMVGVNVTSQVLLKAFFPRWLENLVLWLSSPHANLNEIARYYTEWKERFPKELTEIPAIKQEFARALGVIKQRKNNLPIQLQPVVQPAPPTQAPPASGHFFNQPPPPTNNPREILEYQARIHGLGLVPLNRKERGQQVYQLGCLSIFFDRSILMALHPATQTWVPMGIPDALEYAKAA